MGNEQSVRKQDCFKLKSSLRMTVQRLRLLQKKKAEKAMKERVYIADCLKNEKYDNARTKVQNIIREDFTVEAYEILELQCNSLISRFSVIQEVRELDPSIAEAVSSICWATPRVCHEIAEMKKIFKYLERRYGKAYVDKALTNDFNSLMPERVSEKLVQKLTAVNPPPVLIEKYLVVIARHYSIEFTPDMNVFARDTSFGNFLAPTQEEQKRIDRFFGLGTSK